MSLYTDVDYPHQPSDDVDWQESFVLVFRDPKTNICGFLRTGAYVNQGYSQVHWGMALPDGSRFRRNRAKVDWEPHHLTGTSFQSGDFTRYTINPDFVRFQGFDKDAELDIRMFDYHPSQDWEMIGAEAPIVSRGGQGHPESGGRIEGRIRIGDRVIDIADGFGYRDHSFGPRKHNIFRANRWHAGTLGPALSYSLVYSVASDGSAYKFGWLVREGKREKIKDLHTVSMTLSDGYSVIGGWTVVELDNGETLRIEAETIDGIVTSTHLVNGGPGSSPAGIEAISIPRCGDLVGGVCDFNMIDNAHRGEMEVSHTLLANVDDGLSRRPFDPGWVR